MQGARGNAGNVFAHNIFSENLFELPLKDIKFKHFEPNPTYSRIFGNILDNSDFYSCRSASLI